MDREQAQRIVRETFEDPFDKGRFVLFVKNLLNSIEEAPFSYKGNLLPDAYDQYISTLERIGKYTDGFNKIDILVVKLKKETSIDRARTMQRNFIAWYLNGSRGGEQKDAALVAFVSPGQEDWRFSLIKMDYRFAEDKNGKTKVKEEFTPARRWSFLVGANEKSHTAQSRLVPIMSDDEHNPTLAELEQAFNIETVTKEFFGKYKELFLWAKDTLDKIVSENKAVEEDFAANNVNTTDFSKKLLGQIVFLYFLQKKGWFGVARDAIWGTGPKNFLRELFDRKHGGSGNFFNDILEPLFYEALARERDGDFYSRFNCKIPFLNGGLFDPIGGYDWVHTDILLPDELFSNNHKTGGDTGNGVLDIFDRYNFTVKEDEPLEKEVAVDPEMLGKVFENLLEVRDRKSKGTYYTPREIVHYMCRQSLINYLETELNGPTVAYEKLGHEQMEIFGNEVKDGQLDLTITHASGLMILREDIETLIQTGEQLGENDSIALEKERRILEGKQKTSTKRTMLPDSIRENAKLVDEKLANIKVCDPAIGSGAFPVGMMNEIVKARSVLSLYIKEQDRTPYHFKRECIERSLYGVDIDPGAVEIAKLRLWLSLVVDEDDIRQIKPLPNLDYKIVCGNSLLSVEQDLLNFHLFKQLESLKPLLFNETSPKKKSEYKKKIDGLISEITRGHQEFDCEVFFSEVFHEKGGFDIVIANPPYVFGGSSKISNEEKKIYKATFFSGTHKINLFAIFIEQGVKILRDKGFLTYITPNTLLRVTSYDNIREFICHKTAIREIIDLDVGVFEGVTSSTIIISLEKKKPYKTDRLLVKRGLCTHPENIIEQKEFDKKGFIFDIFSEQNHRKLITKLLDNAISLGELSRRIRFGVVITNNYDEVVKTEKLNSHWKPFLEGNDIGSFFIKYSGKYLLYKKQLLHRSRTPDIFDSKKIIIQRITGGEHPVKAAFDRSQFYNKESIINLILKTDQENEYKYILALLNSKLINWYYKMKFTNGSKLTVNLSKEYLSEIPIKSIKSVSAPDLNTIVSLVDNIMLITSLSDFQEDRFKCSQIDKYKTKLDELIFKVYELKPEDINLVIT